MLIKSSLGLSLLVLSSLASAQNPSITTIDVPGAVWTLSVSINAAGTIAGSYSDDITYYGFLRDCNGNLTSFTSSRTDLSYRTQKHQLSRGGNGRFLWGTGAHGFLRFPSGAFSTFDVPVAINGTFPTSINQTGTITGSYLDQNRRNHGFLRTPDGGIRTFNSPGGARHPPKEHQQVRGDHRILQGRKRYFSRFLARDQRQHHSVQRTRSR